jgi:glycosyltransferase involved in cell wall biosynthesis
LGIPSVAFDYPPNRAILGEFGIYAKKEDTLDMAKKILDLLRDDKKREKISLGLKKRLKDKFDWRIRADKLENLLNKLN